MIFCNLFSIFDPALSLFSSSWLIIFSFIMVPATYFLSSSFMASIYYTASTFSKEISFNIFKFSKGFNSFLTSLFVLILFYNFLALFPHLFSTTSHLLTTLPLAYTFWVSIILFNLMSFFKYFVSHFIPMGTPIFLMSFMVVVEILSNLIRPLALTFRLTANMMAGHLLMSLVSKMLITLPLVPMALSYITQFLLVFMELGVSFIQAYVFFTLLLLYASESE